MAELRAVSAAIGADPLLTQGAGGNTSVKDRGILWIKASGTWLMQAEARDIFVPVEIAPLVRAVEAIAPEAEEAQRFVLTEFNPEGLRPSIETTVHALMPQRVVLHVHCVDTIAWAVQRAAAAALEARLSGLDWAFIPYARPGLPLALAIARARGERARAPDVLILGNHGLVVAGEDVAAAERLLREVKARLALPPRRPSARPEGLAALKARGARAGYALPAEAAAHAVALDPVALRLAAGGSLYPDHVIFLGKAVTVAEPGEEVARVVARLGASPPAILFPGEGALIREGASAGAEAMLRCLAEVTTRIPETAVLRYLTEEEHLQLTDWDAEKYRQSLDRAREGKA